ncbi:ATP synthase subunit f, mitochondrial [Triplophysa dalaica]|uniref:ATP synthase subunit f, mitochondrial n=1 Tax=Triplophysa dalaica TaxID=1582913 RepID=UPI0024DF9B0D|nr:ATP synthase subunit f, mitochondrial [Triplophysa dalaica]
MFNCDVLSFYSQHAPRHAIILKFRQSKMADKAVSLAEKRLLDVKLGQVPSWLGTRDFTPNGLLGGVRRGYERYYNKYINVKKGGIGGVAMFLVGYVALSYLWEYDHIKHDRWRKYH